MKFELLGRPPDGPTLSLDYREFAYAGKFVMSSTGKTVAREGGEILGALAFSPDHDDPAVVHLRYVTVRDDRQGEGIGSRLLRFSAETLQGAPYETVTIAVNNPLAYQACYRAGFAFTGRETGIAELVMTYTPDEHRSSRAYRDGLKRFEERDLPQPQQAALERTEIPDLVDVPTGGEVLD